MQTVILGLINPLMAMLFSAIFGLLWWFDRSRLHNALFAVSYLLLGTGFLVSLAISFMGPAWAFSYSALPFSVGTIALVAGLCWRIGVQPPMVTLSIISLISFAMVVVIDIMETSVASGLYISNTTYGIMMLIGTSKLTHKPRETRADHAIFAMCVLATAQFFLRPAFSFAFEGDLLVAPYRETIYYAVLNTTVAAISLVLALSLIGAAIAEQFASQRDKVSRDILSGLLTRQAFEAEAQDLLTKASNTGVPVSLIVGDIDHFKNVNDIWGHQVGDVAIGMFGELVRKTSRDTDVCGRIGGEEFCILVWNADADVGMLLAERLRVAVSQQQVEGMGPNIHLTASFGCASRKRQESYASLFKRADAALYEAKANGRNRVESSDGIGARSNHVPATDLSEIGPTGIASASRG